jgi:hypothetical protein
MRISVAEPRPAALPARRVFAAIVTVFVIYAALFIYRTSFVVAGERYFSLFDDAMVSMRYARNCARGLGLVWNAGGARVEGFTNPLWVLYMAVIHLLPLSDSKTSLIVQLTAAALLVVNLFLVRELARAACDRLEIVALGAVACTAAYLPINNWALQGMEVSVLVAALTFAAWQSALTLGDGRFRAAPYVVLGLCTLVRLDMAVPLVAVTLLLSAVDRISRRRHVLWGAGSLAAFVILQEAFRLWYYRAILPNTYYLKMTGVPPVLRITRGLYVLAQFAWKFNPLLFALPFVLIFRRDRKLDLLLLLIATQMAYSVYVGGDAWEYWGGSNRYIVIAMPAFFVLLSYGLYLVTNSVAATRTGRQAVFGGLVAMAIICADSIYGPRAWAEVLLVHTPLHSGPGDENNREVEEALRLRTITSPDATITVVRAGTIPYFADRPGIDLLGKNDPTIARLPARIAFGWRRFISFRPGHVKYDYGYSIERARPDVIVQLWEHPEAIRPFIDANYEPVMLGGERVYARKDSRKIDLSRNILRR